MGLDPPIGLRHSPILRPVSPAGGEDETPGPPSDCAPDRRSRAVGGREYEAVLGDTSGRSYGAGHCFGCDREQLGTGTS
jgi:hypothetical protein